MLDIAAVSLAITALLAYLNDRFIGLPTTIGVMVIALALSLAILGLNALGLARGPLLAEESFVRSIDFSEDHRESLFSDGVGVVLFSLLAGVAASGAVPTFGDRLQMLLHEAGGGVAFGWALGPKTLPRQ